MRRMMSPLMKVRRTAKTGPACAPFAACSAVMRDMMAVGPTVMSLELPNSVYTKHPMNAEYRPYWGTEGALLVK